MKTFRNELGKLKRVPEDQLEERERRERANELANECLNSDFLSGVKTILHAVLVEALIHGMVNKMKVEERLPTLQMAIYAKLRSIELFEDLDGWREKLKKLYTELEAEKIKE